MGKYTCPERNKANAFLAQLERAGLKNTMVYRMLVSEQSRDMLTAESRLVFALPKAEALLAALKAAGRNKKARQAAKDAIKSARTKVR